MKSKTTQQICELRRKLNQCRSAFKDAVRERNQYRAERNALLAGVPLADVKLLLQAIVLRSDGYCTGDKETDLAVVEFVRRHPKLLCGRQPKRLSGVCESQAPEFDL